MFAVDRRIYALDTTTFTIRRVVRASGNPIGLSVEGSRVAWAENADAHGLIRAVYLR